MGYDFTVTKGNVRLAEAHTLIRELLELAWQLELPVIPVNWLVSDTYRSGITSKQFMAMFFGEPPIDEPLAAPTAVTGRAAGGGELTPALIQGVVFAKSYRLWHLTWNVSRGGSLGEFHQVSGCLPGESYDPMIWGPSRAWDVVCPRTLLTPIGDPWIRKPAEINGKFEEDCEITLRCPWRRWDAAAACDVLNLLSRHCDDFEVEEEGFGIWPNKDFTRWINFASKWAAFSGFTPVHPDPTEQLPPGGEKQGT